MTDERPERVTAALAERELDLLLVSHLVNVRWLTGFTGSSGTAVIGVGGDRVTRRFLTDFRYLSAVRGAARRVLAARDRAGPPGVRGRRAAHRRRRAARLRRRPHVGQAARASSSGSRPGTSSSSRPAASSRTCGMVKDAEEIERIRAAALLADAALEAVLGRGLAGRTEQEVAFDLETEMRTHGRRGPVVPVDRRLGRARRAAARGSARRRDPRRRARHDRLGRAARRLRLGLHADVRDRADLRRRPRHLRARPARTGGRPRGRAPRSDGQGGRCRRAGDHRRGGPRGALRPRARARRGDGGPRGARGSRVWATSCSPRATS